MRLDFEYPITRIYPWRYTTTFVILASSLVLAVLVYVNLAFVGVMTYTKASPTFVQGTTPSWTDRMRIWTLADDYNTGCESINLLTGGMYQTPNAAFTYNVRSLSNSHSSFTSNANYNGWSLDRCTVGIVNMVVNFAAYEANFEFAVNCLLPGDMTLNATTGSVVKAVNSDYNKPIASSSCLGPTASKICRLMLAFNSDFFQDVLYLLPEYNRTLPPVTVDQTFQLHANSTVEWLYGAFTGLGVLKKDPGQVGFQRDISPSSVTTIENYIHIVAGSILTDLGAAPEQNALASVEAFQDAVKPINTSWRLPSDHFNLYTMRILNGGMEEYNLPFTSIQPTSFNAYYLCHYRSWKAPVNLVIDVLVSTASLFMVFWSGLNLVMRFYANRAPEGNHCTCANCKNLFGKNDEIVQNHLPSSKGYNKLPACET
ncbi:hypothetical protein FRC12_007941 [Ceratobasidium sp. 428]|nr:hypothetical protein FRC12_007941 [Ceratobasidium sp. 428]